MRPPGTPARRAIANLALPALFVGAVSVAAFFEPVGPRQDTLRIAGLALPQLCTLRSTTGLRCPACGLTRSWVAAAHGRWRWSLAHHRLGWLLLAYGLLQSVRHVTAWGLAGLPDRSAAAARWLDRGAIALGALLLLNWIPTLLRDLSARL